MSVHLGEKIYRERRRLLLVTSLAFLAGVIFYLRADHRIMGVHVSLITGAIYASVVGTTALFFCIVLPSMRFLIEAVAVSRLVFSVFVFSQPQVGYAILASPFLTAAIVVGGGIAISRLLHGDITTRAPGGWRTRFSRKGLFARRPALLRATPWQHRYVGWIDDAVPVRA